MLALVKTKKGVGNIELRDVPIPEYSDDEVLIEIKAAGVCGTDIHIRRDEFLYWPPVILGHEFSGKIVKVGKNVTGWKVNDRVVGEPHTKTCGVCYYCRTGDLQLCSEKRSPGWGIDGACAKYLKYPTRLLHRIPDSLSYEEAALTEPCACIVHSVFERGYVKAQDIVVVIGPGPIGMMAAMAVKNTGAGCVILLGTSKDEEYRLKIARELGLDYVINVEKENPFELILDISNGLGADLAIECAGSEKGIQSSIELIRKRGRITTLGLTSNETIAFPWNQAILKEADVNFSFSVGYTSFERSLSLLNTKKVNAEALISHRAPLSDWENVFDDLENMKGIKGLLIP